MYSPPHEFAINIPRVMAEVRLTSYEQLNWPALLARAYSNNCVAVALAGFPALLVVLLSMLCVNPARLYARHPAPGAFYEVIPYIAMVVPALALFFYAIGVWLAGCVRFWPSAGDVLRGPGGLKALVGTVGEAMSLQYLKGGGSGCYYPEEKPSSLRRIYHSLVFWGFLADLLSTTLAFIYQDLMHWVPPFSITSSPVIFGGVGGVAIIIGVSGLIWLKTKSDPAPAIPGLLSLDYIFMCILGLTALTGMLTLVFRGTSAMGIMLTIHLATIAALFVTAPYGKLAHFPYRFLALLRHRIERNQTLGI
jgi:citrate/tricarballylate utilization protein